MSQAQVVRVKINEQIETGIADPEVTSKATRRRFGQAYKRKVLSEAEACKKPGELGALLRREGLYDSHLFRWRQLRRAGQLGEAKQKASVRDKTLKQEVAKLEAENARLQKRLLQAELVIDVQKNSRNCWVWKR